MKDKTGKKPSAGDRRRSDRFEVQNASAEFRKKGVFSSGHWHNGKIVQLSSRGAAIVSKVPLDYGDKIEALLHFAAYPEPVHVRGKVVRIKTKNPYFEFGMEFLKIKKSDAEKLHKNRYFDSLINRRDSELV